MQTIKKPGVCNQLIKGKLFLLSLFFIYPFFCGSIPQARAVTEDEIRDAILGKTPVDLATMDVNKDGKVDVADLVYLITHRDAFPSDVYGYVWAVAATFTPTKANVPPVKYPFAIMITKAKIATTSVPGFDPTKGILRQNLSGPGEVPGAKRPPSYLSQVIPEGLTFDFVDSADKLTLSSAAVKIAADDPKNPVGLELQRSWTIEINKKVVIGGGTNHGTIAESTTGFLPGSAAISSTGNIYLVPFARVNMAPVETP